MLRVETPVWKTGPSTTPVSRYRSGKVVEVLQDLHHRAKNSPPYMTQAVPRLHTRWETSSAVFGNVNSHIALRLAKAQHSRVPNARTVFPSLRTSLRVKETRSIPRTSQPAVNKVESILAPPAGPSILQEIDDAISKISLGNYDENPTKKQVTVEIFWGLRRCLQTEIDDSADLSSTLTITGNADHSWATSCQKYVSESWAEFGLTLLGCLESVLQKVVILEEATTVSGLWTRFSLTISSIFHPGSDMFQACFRVFAALRSLHRVYARCQVWGI